MKPIDVEDVTQKVLFLDIKDIKPEYSPVAMLYTNRLIDAWFSYCQDHAQPNFKRLTKSLRDFTHMVKPRVMRNISDRKSLAHAVSMPEFANTYH